jgi:hypothetical protein
MFEIQSSGMTAKLLAPKGLTAAAFDDIAQRLGRRAVKARKIGFVAASKAHVERVVETVWNGKETVNTALPGDMIVTNLGPDRTPLRDGEGNLNLYVIKGDRFPELYERDEGTLTYGTIYRSRSTVDALYLPGGMELLAPWGEIQRIDDGYLLRGGPDVYGNAKGSFESTYQILP